MPYRILITTHHITSRSKILTLTRAADAHGVSVLLKMTARPPGIIICEGDDESAARGWLGIVRSLRYLGYRFIKGESLPGPRTINSGKDGVKVVEGTESFVEEIENIDGSRKEGPTLKDWWKEAMGFGSG